MLSDGTANYVYGHERLRALDGPWYLGDALGSVRQTLDDAGGVVGSVQYDPWGVPTAGTPQPFGFTGELHSAGQVYLRARWYAPGQGTFVTKDPFHGWNQYPATLHPYLYVGNNPLTVTDPSGQCYPPLAWLRNVEPTNCQNLDMAIRIAQHPNAARDERALATSYIVTFVGSHAALVVGAGILTWQAIAAGTGVVTAVSQWGAASLGTYPTGAAVAGGVASIADDSALLLGVFAGDAYSANEIHTAQQLAASDGLLPIGDVLAACALIIPRIGRSGDTFISLGRKYVDYTKWRFDGRAPPYWQGVENYADRYNFPDYFREAADNADTIYFDINGVNLQESFQQGAKIVPREEGGSGWTAFELYTLLNNKTYLNKAVFHRNGQTLSREELVMFFDEALQAGWILP